MKTAILHAGHAPTALIPGYGDYDAMSKSLLGLDVSQADSFTVCDGIFPQHIRDYDLYLVTGSPCGAYEDFPWIAKLEDFIRDAFTRQAKLVGLCFGHQIVAQAMGGTVEKSEKGYGIGVMGYTFTEPKGHTRPISLCAWHQDQVICQPPSSSLILTSEFCPIAGLVYGTQAISFQPHPEFSREFMREMISVRRGDTITQKTAEDALVTLTKNTDTRLIQKTLHSFLKT